MNSRSVRIFVLPPVRRTESGLRLRARCISGQSQADDEVIEPGHVAEDGGDGEAILLLVRGEDEEGVRVAGPGSGTAHAVDRGLGGGIILRKVVSDGEGRAGGLAEVFQFVHQVGDFAVGVFVAATEDLVGGVEHDEAEVTFPQVILEAGTEQGEVGLVAAEVPDVEVVEGLLAFGPGVGHRHESLRDGPGVEFEVEVENRGLRAGYAPPGLAGGHAEGEVEEVP